MALLCDETLSLIIGRETEGCGAGAGAGFDFFGADAIVEECVEDEGNALGTGGSLRETGFGFTTTGGGRALSAASRVLLMTAHSEEASVCLRGH